MTTRRPSKKQWQRSTSGHNPRRKPQASRVHHQRKTGRTQIKGQRNATRHRSAPISVVLAIVLAVVLGVLYLQTPSGDQPTARSADQQQDIPSEPAEPVPESVTARYLFSGTIVWDREVEAWSVNDQGERDPTQTFSGLDSYDPGQYDYWVADLECPTSADDIPPEQGREELKFNCRPEYLDEAANYFDAFNLANNHSNDLGQAALDETRTTLQAAGIDPFGDPDSSVTDELCKVLELPVDVTYSDSSVQQQAVPVAMCSWHYFFRLPVDGEIEYAQQFADIMPVFGFVHMGVEYRPDATTTQSAIAQRVIDNGADFVIANNPHWVQNAEVHNGKLIVHSTGNFIFDQLRGEEYSRSVSIQTDVSLQYSDSLQRLIDQHASCDLNTLECREDFAGQGFTAPEFSYDFTPIAGDISSRQQVKGDDALQAQIEQRLNWAEVSAALE